MQLSEVKNLYEQGMIRWSTHCIERMQERDITRADVKKLYYAGRDN